MGKVRALACGVTLGIALTGLSPVGAGASMRGAPDAAVAAVAARPPVVAVTPLAGLDGPAGTATVTDINERGVAVGASSPAGGSTHAVVWDRRGRLTDLTPDRGPTDRDAAAVALNDRGAIVGADGVDFFGGRVFLWEDGADGPATDLPTDGYGRAVDITNRGLVLYAEYVNIAGGGLAGRVWEDGVMTPAPVLPGERPLFGVDVSERGLVVGTQAGLGWLAAAWRPGEPLVSLPFPDGALGAMALAVNDRGDVAGMTYPDQVTPPAVVRWRDGVPEELLGPGGEPSQLDTSVEPRGGSPLNRRGDVVGVVAVDGSVRPVLWGDGTPTLLPMPEGLAYAVPVALNDHRQVVGHGLVDGSMRGFLWEDGQVVDLTALTGVEGDTTITDINDRGQVVGYVEGPDGPVAYRWDLPARL